MTGAIARAPVGGSGSVERLLGLLLALVGLVIVATAGERVLHTLDQFSLWWSTLAFTSVGLVIVIAVGAPGLPWRVLQGLWVAAVSVTLLAQATVFLGYQGAHPDTLNPWIWTLQPVMLCFVALLVPVPFVIGYLILAAVSPALSGLGVFGRVPHEVLLLTPLHLGDAVFVAILYVLWRRLRAHERIEGEARRSAAHRVRAQAFAERQQQLSRTVHDEVLSTLIAATRLPGEPIPELRAAAAKALRALGEAAADPASGSAPPVPGETRGPASEVEVEVGRAREGLVRIAREWIPRQDIELRIVPGGSLPAIVVAETGNAMAEALRNSRTHAADASTRQVAGEVSAGALSLSIVDDGPGFDLDRIPVERLGVRGSILARMRALPGGAASVRADASGTEVRLQWRR